MLCQLVGNFLLLYTVVAACMAYGWDDLIPWALLGPLYWVLMSVSAWRALLSLVVNPHHWSKTDHGASLTPQQRPGGAARRSAPFGGGMAQNRCRRARLAELRMWSGGRGEDAGL